MRSSRFIEFDSEEYGMRQPLCGSAERVREIGGGGTGPILHARAVSYFT